MAAGFACFGGRAATGFDHLCRLGLEGLCHCWTGDCYDGKSQSTKEQREKDCGCQGWAGEEEWSGVFALGPGRGVVF